MLETLSSWAARLAIRIVGLDTVLAEVFRRMAAEGITVQVSHVEFDVGDEDDDGGGDELDPNIWPIPPEGRGRRR